MYTIWIKASESEWERDWAKENHKIETGIIRRNENLIALLHFPSHPTICFKKWKQKSDFTIARWHFDICHMHEFWENENCMNKSTCSSSVLFICFYYEIKRFRKNSCNLWHFYVISFVRFYTGDITEQQQTGVQLE